MCCCTVFPLFPLNSYHGVERHACELVLTLFVHCSPSYFGTVLPDFATVSFKLDLFLTRRDKLIINPIELLLSSRAISNIPNMIGNLIFSSF